MFSLVEVKTCYHLLPNLIQTLLVLEQVIGPARVTHRIRKQKPFMKIQLSSEVSSFPEAVSRVGLGTDREAAEHELPSVLLFDASTAATRANVDLGTSTNPVTDARLTVDESQYGLIRGKITMWKTWAALKDHGITRRHR